MCVYDSSEKRFFISYTAAIVLKNFGKTLERAGVSMKAVVLIYVHIFV